MKLELERTDERREIVIDGVRIAARVWVGQTGLGTPVKAFIVGVVPVAESLAVKAEFADLTAIEFQSRPL